MSKLSQLREQRDAKAREASELNAKYAADKRMPKEDADKMDSLLAQVEGCDGEIMQIIRLDQLTANDDPQAQHEAALNASTLTPGKHIKGESEAIRAFLRGGINGLTQEQNKAMTSRVNPDIRAAMSTTSGGEGGFTTALEYQKSLEEVMKAFGGIRQVATTIQTSTGMAMQFPTADATNETGEIVGQNVTVGRADTTFQLTTMDVYKYSSRDIAIPFELLQDSFIDIEAYIQNVLASRLGRITNQHFTTGNGSGQPFGVVNRASTGKVGTTGQTTTVIYDDLVDLEHSVDPAYRSNNGVGYMMNDLSLRNIRKIKDTQGRPIFVPGYEQGNPGGAPDRLMGRPIIISQEVPQMAANNKSILFGDFSKYIIRDVMDLTLFRMTDSAFTRNGQVGFLAFMRSGGNLVDAGGAIRFYQNSAT